MRKFLLIIVNILLICILLFAVDYLTAFFEYKKTIETYHSTMAKHKDFKKIQQDFGNFHYSLKLIHFSKHWNDIRNLEFSLPKRLIISNSISKTPKPSIIIFGCSFADGLFLKDNETLGYRLSTLTRRTVYNRAFSGFGLGQMVWQTKQKKFYDDIKISPEYAIYVFILDHTRRMYEYKYAHNNVYLSFEEKDGKLIEKNTMLLNLNRLYIVRKFMKQTVFPKLLSKNNNDKNFDLIKLHFEEARKELQKKYPDIKFIIIKHPSGLRESCPEDTYSLEYSYRTPRWQELEDEGFIIYDLNEKLNLDMEDNEYTLPDGHPNSRAWEVVSQKLVQDLNL